MDNKKRNLYFLILLGAGIMFIISSFLFYHFTTNKDNAFVPTLDSIEFTSKIQSFAIKNFGQPIEGFSAPIYLQAFPGLKEADFDGVETYEGRYEYFGGKLIFAPVQTRYISSAGEAISKEGHEILFNNVRNRLGNNLSVEEVINGIIAWKTYNSGEYGFEIKYPGNYSVLKKDDMLPDYIVMFKYVASEFRNAKIESLDEITFIDSKDADAYRNDETHNGDGHFKTIDVTIYNNESNYTLEQWFKKNTEITSFEASFTSKEEITVDGIKGLKGIYGCCMAHKMTVFLGNNGKLYKISGNYLDGDPGVVPISNEEIFDQIIATFKFIKQ